MNMKKLISSLLCAVLVSSARADTETLLAEILEILEYIEVNTSFDESIDNRLQNVLNLLILGPIKTAPVWGPFEEWLTSQFQDYIYYPITGQLQNLYNMLVSQAYEVHELNEQLPFLLSGQCGHLDQMNTEGFNVRIVEQDFTDLETYLQNTVYTQLGYIHDTLQNGLNVHGTVSADFNFDYSRFNDVFSYYAAATGPSRFNLAYHKRYVWSSPFYDSKKPIPEVVSVQEHGGESYDLLGFIEAYCNGQLQNMEQLQAGLVQILGALRGDDAQTEEITDDFESVEDDATSQMTELRNSIDFSKYNFEVSDELFRSEVFAIGNGSSQLPEFVEIGPFDMRGFGPEISTFGFSIDCREWRPFFELCRSCFTIIIYLVICTLALSICFLLWKVGAPCVRVLQNIFNF